MKRRMLAFVISLLLLLPYGFCLPLADTAASLAAAESQAAARDDIPDFRPDDADRGAGRIAVFSAAAVLCGGGLAAAVVILSRGRKRK